MEHIPAHYIEYFLAGVERGTIPLELNVAASQHAMHSKQGVYHYTTFLPWKIGIYVAQGKFHHVEYIQYKHARISRQYFEEGYPAIAGLTHKFKDDSLAEKVFGLRLALNRNAFC